MNCLEEINAFLDQDFKSCFELPSFIAEHDHTDKEYSIDCFKYCFDKHYNGKDYSLSIYVKDLLDVDRIMKICEYIIDKVGEDLCGDISLFENNGIKLIHEYIYYYLRDTHRPEFIQQIEDYYDMR